MSSKHKDKNFIDSDAGSLWYFYRPDLNFKREKLLFIHFNPNNTCENLDFFSVPSTTPIMNLKEETILRTDEVFDKVMAKTTTGKIKIGWMFREETQSLLPYNEDIFPIIDRIA